MNWNLTAHPFEKSDCTDEKQQNVNFIKGEAKKIIDRFKSEIRALDTTHGFMDQDNQDDLFNQLDDICDDHLFSCISKNLDND